MQRTLKLYKLPENTKVPGFRKLVEADIPQGHKILSDVRIFTEPCGMYGEHFNIITLIEH